METAFDLMSFTSASSSFPCLNFCRDLELVPINSFDGDNVFIHYYEKFTCLVLFMLKFFFYAKVFIFTTTLKKFQGEDMPEAFIS